MSFLSEIIIRWRAYRELRKGASIVDKLANELPSSALKGLFVNKDGSPVDPIEARNMLLEIANRVRRESKWT